MKLLRRPFVLLLIVLLQPIAHRFLLPAPASGAAGEPTVGEALKHMTAVEIPSSPIPVESTVAREVRALLASGATLNEVPRGRRQQPGTLRVSVLPAGADSSRGWFRLKITGDGSAELTASHPHLLYTAFCRLRDEWVSAPVSGFAQGRTVAMRLSWLEGSDGLFTGLPRLARGYDPEATIRELARLGCSHVSVNVLASRRGIRTGPPG